MAQFKALLLSCFVFGLSFSPVIPNMYAAPFAPLPGKTIHPEYAERFTITQLQDGCRVIDIVKPEHRKRGLWYRYLLVPKTSPVPQGIVYDELVRTPIKTYTCASGFHVSLIEILGHFDGLVGVSSKLRVGNERVHAMIDEGALASLGMSSNMNMETLVNVKPDMAFVYASGSGYDSHDNIRQLGLKPGLICAQIEAHPLGSLEWIKFLGEFFHEEERAKAYFDSIKVRYENHLKLTSDLQHKPSVIVGHNRKGAWTTHGSSAWFVQYLLDAGANYILEPKSEYEENIISLEVAINIGMNADFWVNPQWETTRISDLIGQDTRYRFFKAVKTGRVYNNNAATFNNGRNRFWETGMARPHIILADLIKIFHPELLPNHQLVYYQKLK